MQLCSYAMALKSSVAQASMDTYSFDRKWSMDSADDASTGDETKHESITISSTNKSTSGKHYRWRMRHYFYIHVLLFIINGLVGGLAVLVIENYLEPNRLMRVRFIDTWFMSASCIFCCGLTTLDFARLSTYSQVILMLFTLSSGITVSTLPALVIKARTHKRESGPKVDDDHSASRLHSTFEKKIPCSPEAESQMARLPTAEQLRYRAYLSCLGLIPFTCLSIYLGAFLCIGGWIRTQYSPGHLRQDGQPVNPWYASFIITVTGFNQNGLTPWSDSLMRFVHDSVLNVLVMLVSEIHWLYSAETAGQFSQMTPSKRTFSMLFCLVDHQWQFPFPFHLSQCHSVCSVVSPVASESDFRLHPTE